MKAFKEKALEYAQRMYPEISAEAEENIDGAIMGASASGFIAGYKDAQEWGIDINYSNHPEIRGRDNFLSRPVIVKLYGKSYAIAQFDCELMKYVWRERVYRDGQVTHWRYIDLK
jgi:hypothetical protein